MQIVARVVACIACALLALNVPAGAVESDDAAQGPMLRVEAGTHIAAIRALAVDAKGALLLTASEDKTARLWDLASQRLLRVLRPPIGRDNEGKLYAAALSPDAGIAAVAGWSEDGAVYLFDTGDGTMRGRIEGLPNVVDALAFSPDGRLLAVLLWGGQGLRLYTSSDGWHSAREVGRDESYGEAPAYGLAFSPDGSRLLTSAYDGKLRLYALRGASLWKQQEQLLGGKPHGIAFAPDGRSVAVGSADTPQVSVLEADTLATNWQSPPLGAGSLPSVAWSADASLLLAGGTWRSAPGQHGVQRWVMATHASSGVVPAASDSITALQLAGRSVIYASGDASWGVVGGAAVRSQRADFRLPMALGPSSLRLSDDARELRFATRFGGQALEDFDLAGPTWRPATALSAEPTAALDLRDWQDSARPLLAGKPLALGPGEVSLTMGRDPSGRAFALGTNHRLRLYGVDGHPLWAVPVPAPCFAVQLSRDGRWVVAGFGDGTLRWYRRSDGAETLAFYPHGDGKGWAAWTPDGRFAAGGGGEQHVGWHLNRGAAAAAEFLPLDRFSERYFDPLGVISALSSQPQVRPVPDLRKGLELPPLVQFMSPHNGSRVDDESVHLAVDVFDRGGGITEVRLLHNGKVVQTASPPAAAAAGPSHLQFDLPLEGGINDVKAVALARDRTESAPAVIKLQAPAHVQRPQLRVLAVGLNSYRNSQFDLRFSVPDARGIAGVFRQLSGKLFADVSVTELYDKDATRAGILAQLRALGATHPDDVVVVYLAGHGDTIGDDWFFVPYEVTQPEIDERLRREALSSKDLAAAIKAMPARKVVVLIDACKSGAALASFRGLEERRLLAQLSRATGTHLIAATNKDQDASELQTLGHGVFTYTLLEGLGGKAATGSDSDVTALKLMAYVEETLPELSKRYNTVEQFPVVSSTGMDFPLVVH
ncbi:MAG: caspase family protein [Paucibacter sp.]|nr:caspase family protein [Roseateles sp.]